MGISILILSVVALLIVTMPIIYKRQRQKQDEIYKSVSRKIGFSYQSLGDGSAAQRFGSFYVFSKHKQVVEDILLTKSDSSEFRAIIHGFSWSSDKRITEDITQSDETVFCFESSKLELPAMDIIPVLKGLLGKMTMNELLRFKGYSRVNHQAIPKKYGVFAKNPEVVRPVLDAKKIFSILENVEGAWISCKDSQLIIKFTTISKFKPDEIPALYKKAESFFVALQTG